MGFMLSRRHSLRALLAICASLVCCVLASCGQEGGNKEGGNPANAEGGQEANGGKGKKLKVAFVTNCAVDFWTVAVAGCRDAEKAFDVDCEILMPTSAAQQKANLEGLLVKQVKGIAVSSIKAEDQTPFFNKVAKQTHLITHDSDAPKSDRKCFIGVDNYEAGYACGQLVREAIPDGGEVMLFIGSIDQDNGKHRRQGTIDGILNRSKDRTRRDAPGKAISEGGFTVLGTQTDGLDEALAKSKAEDAITRHPKLACMVGLFGYNPPQCYQALKQQDKLGKIKIVAFDELPLTLQGIEEGHIHGTVVQDPYAYGYESVRILAALARGEDAKIPENKIHRIEARVIKKHNLKPFWDDLKKKLSRGSTTTPKSTSK